MSDDTTASTPDAARGAILPASDAPGGSADADVLRGRIAALEAVSAENERLRAVVRDVQALHVRIGLPKHHRVGDWQLVAPDRCGTCWDDGNFALWPCSTVRAVLARSQAPQSPAEQEGELSWLEREMARANQRRAETPTHALPTPTSPVRPATADDEGVR